MNEQQRHILQSAMLAAELMRETEPEEFYALIFGTAWNDMLVAAIETHGDLVTEQMQEKLMREIREALTAMSRLAIAEYPKHRVFIVNARESIFMRCQQVVSATTNTKVEEHNEEAKHENKPAFNTPRIVITKENNPMSS